MMCKDCPRFCQVDRKISSGYCGAKDKIVVSKIIENFMWEEPCITGDKGTLAIFFAGCNLKCKYCQNYKISNSLQGEEYSPEEFAKYLNQYDYSKYNALEFISPTHFTSLLIETFKKFKCSIPVVWNSGGYENVEKIKEISAFVDIFLPDFKYSDNKLAEKFSLVNNYCEISLQAIKEMSLLKKNIIEKGVMQQGVLIRHLILPGYIKNSYNVLDLIKNNIPNPIISIMGQFTPINNSISRTLSPLENKAVLEHAQKIGLNNGYFQDLASAKKDYIPKF